MHSAAGTQASPGWVSPFRDLRITACLAAPRSLSQPRHVFHRSLAPGHPPSALLLLDHVHFRALARPSRSPGSACRAQGALWRTAPAYETWLVNGRVVSDTTNRTVPNCQRTAPSRVRGPASSSRPARPGVPGRGCPRLSGDDRARTDNLCLAKAALSQIELHPRSRGFSVSFRASRPRRRSLCAPRPRTAPRRSGGLR